MTSAKFSTHTPTKQHQLKSAVSMFFQVMKGAMVRENGRAMPCADVFDLHAGNGAPNGSEGSPLILSRVALEVGLPHRLWLFEKNRRAAQELKARDLPHATVLTGLHERTVHEVLPIIDSPRPRYGLIYVDPNDDHIPISTVRYLTAGMGRRTDVLIHISATARKRHRIGHRGVRLSKHLEELEKRHIFVRTFGGAWQWAMFLATNWPDARAPKDWIALRTPAGARILDQLDWSTKEWQHRFQLKLPGIEAMPNIYDTPDFELSELS